MCVCSMEVSGYKQPYQVKEVYNSKFRTQTYASKLITILWMVVSHYPLLKPFNLCHSFECPHESVAEEDVPVAESVEGAVGEASGGVEKHVFEVRNTGI